MKYNEQLSVTLEEDEFSQKQRLAFKLEQVHNIMESNPWADLTSFYIAQEWWVKEYDDRKYSLEVPR